MLELIEKNLTFLPHAKREDNISRGWFFYLITVVKVRGSRFTSLSSKTGFYIKVTYAQGLWVSSAAVIRNWEKHFENV